MLGLLKYPDDFSKSQGLNQLWYKDTTAAAQAQNIVWNVRKLSVINHSDPKGTFSFRISLKHIFGFCEDYKNVLYGMTQTLTLTRNGDGDANFRDNGSDPGKITLNKLSWFMPHVMPADREKMEPYKIIEKKEKIRIGYRTLQCDSISVPQPTTFTWRLSVKSSPEVPRFIVVGFLTDKTGNQEENSSISVKTSHVMLNSTTYPMVDYNRSFDKQ